MTLSEAVSLAAEALRSNPNPNPNNPDDDNHYGNKQIMLCEPRNPARQAALRKMALQFRDEEREREEKRLMADWEVVVKKDDDALPSPPPKTETETEPKVEKEETKPKVEKETKTQLGSNIVLDRPEQCQLPPPLPQPASEARRAALRKEVKDMGWPNLPGESQEPKQDEGGMDEKQAGNKKLPCDINGKGAGVDVPSNPPPSKIATGFQSALNSSLDLHCRRPAIHNPALQQQQQQQRSDIAEVHRPREEKCSNRLRTGGGDKPSRIRNIMVNACIILAIVAYLITAAASIWGICIGIHYLTCGCEAEVWECEREDVRMVQNCSAYCPR